MRSGSCRSSGSPRRINRKCAGNRPSVAPAKSRVSGRTCEPFRDLIGPALARGRNAMTIWQDLLDEHGFRGGFAETPAREFSSGQQLFPGCTPPPFS
jgi:hypothetical protein